MRMREKETGEKFYPILVNQGCSGNYLKRLNHYSKENIQHTSFNEPKNET